MKVHVENLEKSMRKPGNKRPNSSKMRPKINPKSSKNQSKNHWKPSKNHCRSLQKRIWIHGRFRDPLGEPPNQIFGRFWAPSWTQPDARWLPKWRYNYLKIDAKIVQKVQASCEGIEVAPGIPKTAPRCPQGAPRYSKNGKIGPKRVQVRTKINCKSN